MSKFLLTNQVLLILNHNLCKHRFCVIYNNRFTLYSQVVYLFIPHLQYMFLLLGVLVFIMSMSYRIACRDLLWKILICLTRDDGCDCRAVCVPGFCSIALQCTVASGLITLFLCQFLHFNDSVVRIWSDAAELSVLEEWLYGLVGYPGNLHRPGSLRLSQEVSLGNNILWCLHILFNMMIIKMYTFRI